MEVDGSSQVEKSQNNDADEITCPLFMIGLPKDFATNPQLAAIASLLKDDENKSGDKEMEQGLDEKIKMKKSFMINRIHSPTKINRKDSPPSHVGFVTNDKLRRRYSSSSLNRRQRQQRRQRACPYPEQHKRQKANDTSVGEATIFLNMWKL